MSTTPPPLDPWAGLLDDTAPLAGGRGPAAAVRAYAERPEPMVGLLVVHDTDLPAALEACLDAHHDGPDRPDGPASPGALAAAPPGLGVRLGGGAGGLAGPASLCARRGVRPARVELALRDADDLAGNARRVVAAVDSARSSGDLAEETVVTVALPHLPGPRGGPGHGWLAAADELASAELALRLPTTATAVAPAPDPSTVLGWLDAALDRELPVTCAATGAAGVAGLLLGTRLALDGAPAEEVAPLLTGEAAAGLRDRCDEVGAEALGRTRRWLLGVAVEDAATAADGLRSLLGEPS